MANYNLAERLQGIVEFNQNVRVYYGFSTNRFNQNLSTSY